MNRKKLLKLVSLGVSALLLSSCSTVSTMPSQSPSTSKPAPKPTETTNAQVLRDCMEYQGQFDTSDYRDFLWHEGQDIIVGNETLYKSPEFGAAWDELFVEFDQTGSIDWANFVVDLAWVCLLESDFELSVAR